MRSISPWRQHVSSAPMMRSCIAGPTNLCSAAFIVRHAARSVCSSSRWMRRSRFVSSLALIVTPKRWNGVVASSGGSWNRPQLIAARTPPRALLTVSTLGPWRYCDLNRAMSAGFSNAVTGRLPSEALSAFRCPTMVGTLEAFRIDVVRLVAIEKLRDRQHVGRVRLVGWDAWIPTGDDLAQEFRLPDAFGNRFRRHSFAGAAHKREFIHAHAPPLAAVHHVEPPRV